MALEKTWMRKGAEKVEADAAAKKAAATPEAADTGPTIPEIIHDENESRGFGQFLASKKLATLVQLGARMKSGALDEADMATAAKYRAEYLTLKDRAEKLGATAEARLADLRSASPDLDNACKTFGQENYVQVLKKGLTELATSDPIKFEAAFAQYKKLLDKESDMDDPKNATNKRITDFCKNYALSDDKLEKLMNEPDLHKRIDNIQKVLRDDMGFFTRWVDKYKEYKDRTSSLDNAEEIAKSVEERAAALKDRELLSQNVGNILNTLISKNPSLRNALVTAKPGEEMKIKGGSAATTSFEQAKSLEKFVPADIKSSWTQHLVDKGITDFARETPASQNTLRKQFTKEYAKKKTTGSGFWATVAEFLLASKLDSNARVQSELI